jgi:MSHA biogenesis protein MshG
MPTFAYKGRNSGGQLVEGVLEGANAGAIADLLHGQGLTPVDIRESPTAATKSAPNLSATLFAPKVSTIDLLLFSRQMHRLLKSGVPIMRALNGLREAATNPTLKGVIGEVRESLEGGRDLSQALARHPRIFSPFYLSMIRVGEATGLLEEIFFRLFEHLEFERYMREQVKAALRYPSFVIVAMAVAIVVINIFVIPVFAEVFAGFGAELPLMTRALLGFSALMVNYWPHLLAIVIGCVLVFRAWVGTVNGRYEWTECLCAYRLPARFCTRRRCLALPAVFPWPCKAAFP